MRYFVVTFASFGFMPKDKILLKTRYKKFAYFFAKLYKKYFLKKNFPLAIQTFDASNSFIIETDWLVPWANQDERKVMKPVDWVENHTDVVKIIPGPSEPLPKELADRLEDFEQKSNQHLAKTILTEEQFLAQQNKNKKIFMP